MRWSSLFIRLNKIFFGGLSETYENFKISMMYNILRCVTPWLIVQNSTMQSVTNENSTIPSPITQSSTMQSLINENSTQSSAILSAISQSSSSSTVQASNPNKCAPGNK